jgi:putative MATE family efflux protein
MNDPHILGTERIGKLLVQYSIPAIIGMTITSLYNIIDSIFIGHGVGAMGIAGLAITFPLMNLVVAFCTVVSAGGSTISSIRLGQKDTDGATEVLNHTLMLCLVNAFLFGGISFIFLDEILRFFGASNETLPYARNFMQIILLGTPVTYTMIGLNNIMRATGYPKKAMLTSMVTVVCNIILAPIFIFHFDWGIRGAATATVISQFIGMIWVVSHFLQKTSIVRLQPGFWKMKKRIISSIFSIGMSPFLMNVTACVIVIIVNNSLQRYGGDMLLLRREDFDELLDRAAERGAERVLTHLGLENGHAARDIRELRDLLEAWRDARRTAWQTTVKVITTGILAALLVGAAIKLKLMGDPQ